MFHVKYFTTFATYKQKTNKCMKNLSLKILALGILALFAVTTISAQEEPAKKKNKFGLANRVGVGVGYGTEGLGFDVAIPLTQYVQVRAGLNFFPNIKFHENIAVEYVGETPIAGEQTIEDEVRLDAKFGRTYADLKFDVYPFGNRGNFFVTAGLSFGGSDLLSIKGHSGKVAEYGPTIKDYGINIGDYNIPFDENGDIKGGVKVKKVRPYLGLGFGRLIPKRRIGFRFELGAQFQGKPKVYAGDIDNVLENKQVTDAVDEETKDDIAKVMDWLKVYPVMKFSIRGRIL